MSLCFGSAISRLARLLFATAMLAVSLLGSAPAQPAHADAASAFTGWVLDAYPSMSSSDMVAALHRMQAAGANVLWIGHNNPVGTDPNAKEVALSYAVFQAATNISDPQYANAQSILAAQYRLLKAARTVGIKVVLPISYRTQMGPEWSSQHPGSLRLGPDGKPLNFGGLDGAPYDSLFQADMLAYYQWIDRSFVQPYRDVLQMVMLSNEPTGVDYSGSANSVFYSRYGYHFADVGNDTGRQTQLGYFQSHVMSDFAIWAANQWMVLDPTMTVTIAFDGSPARNSQEGPPLEPIFSNTPSNFVPTWDTNLRNGSPSDALNDSDLTTLDLLLGTLGHLSAKYNRPYWLWSSGNSWGLGQGSSDPSTIADAVVNLRMDADLSREEGGLLRGIAVWAYNVRGQGLYNDSYTPVYNPDALFSAVSANFESVRQIMLGPSGPGPSVLVLAPHAMPDRLIGSTRLTDIWSFRGYNFGDLVSLARSGAPTAVVASLSGEHMANVQLLVVLARDPNDYTSSDEAAIKAFRARGGTLVDSLPVETARRYSAQWVAPANAPEYYFSDTYTANNVGPVGALGDPRLANSFVFAGPSELLAYGGTSFDPSVKMRAYPNLPFAATLTDYDASNTKQQQLLIGPGLATVDTTRRTYGIVSLLPSSPDMPHDKRYFSATGFRINSDVIWDYFNHRGGLRTFGYPTSRLVLFEGFPTQFFQRLIVQVYPDGSPHTLNLLDSGLLPYKSFNGSAFPAVNAALIASAPTPSSPTYATDAVAWTLAHAPDTWNGLSVNFGSTFLHTTTLADAFPDGGGDPALVPLLNLELWGLPTSRPAFDPSNHNFVYLRFQRGVMHYDTGCNCTQGILLADYLKALLINTNVPPDLEQEAVNSRFLGQYTPAKQNWLRDSSVLPGTDLTDAFEQG